MSNDGLIRNESNEAYHKNEALSSTMVKHSAVSWRYFRDHQMGLIERVEKQCWNLGTALHTAILEPHLLDSIVAFKPKGMSFANKEGKAWRAEQKASAVIIDYKQADALKYMVERIPKHIREIFEAKGAETEIGARVMHENGYMVQARADQYQKGVGLFDVKSTRELAMLRRKGAYDLGYHISAAWYIDCFFRVTGEKLPFTILAVDSSSPFNWQILDFDPDLMKMGEDAVGAFHDGYDQRLVSGDWSDDIPKREVLDAPKWVYQQMDEGEYA